jgi:putative transposase
MKTLIAYYSRKGQNYVDGKIVNLAEGNTEVAAGMIERLTGGDVFRIETKNAYPAMSRYSSHGDSRMIQPQGTDWSLPWVELLKSSGVESVRIPASSPNCSPHAERFVRTVRSECLEQFVIFAERHLRHLLREFIPHYLGERFHQGLDGKLIAPATPSANDNSATGEIRCRSRLGGLLNYYHREAA